MLVIELLGLKFVPTNHGCFSYHDQAFSLVHFWAVAFKITIKKEMSKKVLMIYDFDIIYDSKVKIN